MDANAVEMEDTADAVIAALAPTVKDDPIDAMPLRVASASAVSVALLEIVEIPFLIMSASLDTEEFALTVDVPC